MVATIDFSETPPILFVGEYVTYDDLHLTNLRDDTFTGGARATNVKGLNCPQCGAPIELRTGALAQSVACPSCAAILDARDPNLAVSSNTSSEPDASSRPFRLAPRAPSPENPGRRSGFRCAASPSRRGVPLARISALNAERGFRYLTEYDGTGTT
jgi:hypothetical protein